MAAIVYYLVKRGDDGRYADGDRRWDAERAGGFRFEHGSGKPRRTIRGHVEASATDHAETFAGMLNQQGQPADVHVVRVTEDGATTTEERV